MSGHTGCIRLKIKNSWWNRNGHNVQIWLTTGHSNCFFILLKNVLGRGRALLYAAIPRPHAPRNGKPWPGPTLSAAAPKAHETWSMATVSGAESQDPPLDRWTPVPLPESLPEALQALGSDATRKLLTDPDRRRYAGYQVLRGAFFLGLRNVSALQSRLLAEGAGADPAATLLTVRPNWNAKAYGCAPSLRVRRPQEGALRCDPDVEER